MKISEIKGEKALDVLAEIIEPLSAIFGDEEVKKAYDSGTIATFAKMAIARHKKDIIAVLAGVNMMSAEEYAEQMNVFTLPVAFIDLINDDAVKGLFPSRGQETENASFGSATENTGVEEN